MTHRTKIKPKPIAASPPPTTRATRRSVPVMAWIGGRIELVGRAAAA